MTGQPYLRQVRFLAACAAVTAAITVCSLYLIRVECDRLAAGAATERALRGAMHERIVQLEFTAAAHEALERAPQTELAGIRNAERSQERALQQVALLSLMILLAGFSGAALLIFAGRILTRHFERETGALQSLYKHTVKRTNRIFDQVGGVASAIGKVAIKLAPASPDTEGCEAVNTELIESAAGAARELQIGIFEIGRVTEQIRAIAFRTNILDLKTAVKAGDAVDDVAMEAKSLVTGIGSCTVEIDAQIKALEAKVAGIDTAVTRLRHPAVVPAIPRTRVSEREQLYKLAAAMEALCGRPAPDRSNPRRSKSTEHSDSANTVLLQSVPSAWP